MVRSRARERGAVRVEPGAGAGCTVYSGQSRDLISVPERDVGLLVVWLDRPQRRRTAGLGPFPTSRGLDVRRRTEVFVLGRSITEIAVAVAVTAVLGLLGRVCDDPEQRRVDLLNGRDAPLDGAT